MHNTALGAARAALYCAALVTRYGLIFLSFGLASGLAAANLPGPARWLLAWASLGFVLVSVAYFTETPQLMGKRQDGTLSPVTVCLCFPVLLLNYGLFHLMRTLRDEAIVDEVLPGLHVGGLPSPGDLPEEIETIVDLTFEFIAHPEVRRHPGYRSYPMLDDGFPGPARVEQIVRELADRPGPMLVHCAGGHGRSATLAAALLIARGQFESVEAAERAMQKARPLIRLRALQRERLAAWLASRSG